MGRLWPLCLLVAGCGRLGFDGMGGGSGSGSGGFGSNTSGLTTEVCTSVAWSSVAASLDTDVSVATTPTGATVFGVSAAGGSLFGFNVDATGTLVGNPAGTVLRNDGVFHASAAAYVDSTLIAAVGATGSRVLVNIIPADLSSHTEIANLDGERVGKYALLHADTARFTPTACSAGLTVNPFDGAWTPQTSQLSVTTSQSTGIGSTPFGTGGLVAWSTATQCYVEKVMTITTGTGSMQPFACNAPRLASDEVASSTIVFEAADGVRVGTITQDQLDPTTTLLAPGATSPRVMFDGARTWISYLDAAGDVEVGFLDGASFVGTVVSGTRPLHDSYELALVGGSPWIVSVDAAGFAGHQLCVFGL